MLENSRREMSENTNTEHVVKLEQETEAEVFCREFEDAQWFCTDEEVFGDDEAETEAVNLVVAEKVDDVPPVLERPFPALPRPRRLQRTITFSTHLEQPAPLPRLE